MSTKVKSLHFINSSNSVDTSANSAFFLNFLYQGAEKSTVSWVFEDLEFKILEGYDQFWSKPSERGNAQKGLLAHLAALFLLFLVFEFFSFGPPLETMKKK